MVNRKKAQPPETDHIRIGGNSRPRPKFWTSNGAPIVRRSTFLAGRMKTFWLVALFVLLQSALFDANAVERIALIIGNANYSQLGTLANPSRDATQVEHELAALGFSTKLIIDANEQSLRREIRAFSGRSEGASVALVYYAGHGAQINGDNYLLPVDLDAPNRESDIQLSAIKVDDLLVSLKSQVKIIFLDACRDNPVLFRNLSKGRGASFSRGLAAPKDSSPNTDASRGGIFIGYATDAGSIAADGNGQNSPFTEAFLRHIRKPVSIDDMFSMVTRDVRRATGNKQRPYKYASMEQVICLTQSCGILISDKEKNATSPAPESPLQTVLPTPIDTEIQLAFSENNFERIAEIAVTLANTKAGISLRTSIEAHRRLYTDEWVAIDATPDKQKYYYYQPSGNGRTWVNMRIAIKGPISTANKLLPKFGDDSEQGPNLIQTFLQVFDCKARKTGFSYTQEHDVNGKILNPFTAGDPRIVDLPIEIKDLSIFNEFRGLVCPPKNAGRIVSAEDILQDEIWKTLVSIEGTVGVIALLKDSVRRAGDEVTAVTIFKGISTVALEMYRYNSIVYKTVHRCNTGEMGEVDADFLDPSGRLVGKLYEKNVLNWVVPVKSSPLDIVHKTLCISS